VLRFLDRRQSRGAGEQISHPHRFQFRCLGNIISGNLSVNENASATAIYSNTVGGSLLDQQHSQPTQVVFNHVIGNLIRQSNASITGGGNTATKKQSQCAAF